MFTYCLNNPVIRIDYGGNRSYFINGIGNYEKDDAPGYAKNFENELEECGGGEVVLIPVYKGQSNEILTVVGGLQVVLEMLNFDIYTDMVVNSILTDLAENPLAEGETLNLIGYSGGGQLALNTMEALAAHDIYVDNVVLIGAPVAEVWYNSTKVSMLWSSKDVLSWNICQGVNTHYVGHLGHQDYFRKAYIKDTAMLVASILKE